MSCTAMGTAWLKGHLVAMQRMQWKLSTPKPWWAPVEPGNPSSNPSSGIC